LESHEVYFQVQALDFNHTQKSIGDQGLVLNWSDWVPIYTVKCLC